MCFYARFTCQKEKKIVKVPIGVSTLYAPFVNVIGVLVSDTGRKQRLMFFTGHANIHWKCALYAYFERKIKNKKIPCLLWDRRKSFSFCFFFRNLPFVLLWTLDSVANCNFVKTDQQKKMQYNNTVTLFQNSVSKFTSVECISAHNN